MKTRIRNASVTLLLVLLTMEGNMKPVCGQNFSEGSGVHSEIPQEQVPQDGKNGSESVEAVTHPAASVFRQWPLPNKPEEAVYSPQKSTRGVLLKVFKISGSMRYTLEPATSPGTWRLTVKPENFMAGEKYDFYHTIDSVASLLSESTVKTEKNMVKRGESIEKRIRVERKEDMELLGTNKYVTIQKDEKDGRSNTSTNEWIVGPNDPIVTTSQMLIWISTLRSLPPEGVLVRWIAEDRPLPVIVRSVREGENWIFVAYAAPDLKIREANGEYLFKFVYDQDRGNTPGFMFPKRILFCAPHGELVFERTR
ncbi:MAG: hypothetical protein Q4D98_03095 [Planctomycetia bacterium]|nr:hypothetical protein [Planctomycetia bacterium]